MSRRFPIDDSGELFPSGKSTKFRVNFFGRASPILTSAQEDNYAATPTGASIFEGKRCSKSPPRRGCLELARSGESVAGLHALFPLEKPRRIHKRTRTDCRLSHT